MRLLIPMFVLFTLCLPAHARWATPDDAEWATESLVHDVEVETDGTYKMTTESTVRILRDGARAMSNYRLSYNSQAAKLKVLDAETINPDGRYKVDREFIED